MIQNKQHLDELITKIVEPFNVKLPLAVAEYKLYSKSISKNYLYQEVRFDENDKPYMIYPLHKKTMDYLLSKYHGLNDMGGF